MILVMKTNKEYNRKSTNLSYTRINNMSVLILISSYPVMISSMICEYGNGIGWTLYPPLSISMLTLGIDLILYSLLLSGMSSSLTSINLIVTLHIMKANIIPL